MSSNTIDAKSKSNSILGPFKNVQYEHLVAGISGGVASTLLLHPLDLMKIRFSGKVEIFSAFLNNWLIVMWFISVSDISHSGQATIGAARPQYNGLINAFSQVLRSEGVKGLYRGVTPNIWGAGSAWGLYFLL